jgi:putative FmdB family regulatory protein
MPTYEYECTKCNHAFEEEASILAPPRQRCPLCRGKVQRLISGGSGVVFRGSGFYVTDSRKGDPARSRAENAGGSGEASSAGDSGKSAKASTTAAAPTPSTTAAKPAAPAHDSKSRTSDKP